MSINIPNPSRISPPVAGSGVGVMVVGVAVATRAPLASVQEANAKLPSLTSRVLTILPSGDSVLHVTATVPVPFPVLRAPSEVAAKSRDGGSKGYF